MRCLKLLILISIKLVVGCIKTNSLINDYLNGILKGSAGKRRKVVGVFLVDTISSFLSVCIAGIKRKYYVTSSFTLCIFVIKPPKSKFFINKLHARGR